MHELKSLTEIFQERLDSNLGLLGEKHLPLTYQGLWGRHIHRSDKNYFLLTIP